MTVSKRTVKSLLLLCLAVVLFYLPILFGNQFSILTGFDAATIALRGIVVPAGNCHVVLRYAPWSVTLGASLSLLAFIGTFILAVVIRARTRRDSHPEVDRQES